MSVPWIVVFDPHRRDRASVRGTLASAGYDTSEVGDALGFRELVQEQPDVVVVAYSPQTPNLLDTLELAAEEAEGTPFVVLADEIPKTAAPRLSQIAHELLLKPVATRRLLQSVHHVLERAERRWQSSGGHVGLVRNNFEEERTEAARRFQLISIHGDDLFCEIDQHGRLRFASDNTCTQLGRPLNILMGHPAWELASNYHQQTFATSIKDALEEAESRQAQIQLTALPGRWFEASIAPFGGPDGETHALISFRDITGRVTAEFEQRSLNDKLRRVQRRETVGRLASGVAHDFNNLLTAIFTYAQLTYDAVEHDPQAAADVKEIMEAGNSAALLTKQLQLFRKREFVKPSVVHLNQVIRGMRRLVTRTVPEDVRTSFVLLEGALTTRIDLVHLQQAILALVLNARDEVNGGDTIEVQTGNIVTRDGAYVFIAVLDDGNPSQGERLSSERASEEDGFQLGLHVARHIAEEYGGALVLTPNSAGKSGRRAELRLPVVVEDVDHYMTPSKGSSGDESVLIVEDQEIVLQVVKRILVRAGYDVLSAPNAQEALSLLERCGGDVDILLTDIVMPGTSGRELARTVQMAYPSTRVLYMTGYPDDEIIQRGVQDKTPVLEKPFTPEELMVAIRRLLM